MGDMGNTFNAMKQATKEHRAKMLAQANTNGWTQHTEYHFSRMFGGKRIEKNMRSCGKCAYALFAPLHCCLAPMKVGDPRREKYIDADTQCFTGQYTEKTDSKLKQKMHIKQAKEALKKKEGDSD